MSIAILQFCPFYKNVEASMQKANQLLSEAQFMRQLDWLVLPEMAFTGYNFQSVEAITPVLEPANTGPTTQWAQNTARHLNCVVTVGYPEIDQTVSPPRNYNSLVTVLHDGTIHSNYRKSFLYYHDETWAKEGHERVNSPGSYADPFHHSLLGHLGTVSMGICMDLNNYKFLAPFELKEFANAALLHGSKYVCLSMAWLSALQLEELREQPREPDGATLNYWLTRLDPLIRSNRRDPFYVILANRTGVEGIIGYAGTSCVMRIHEGRVAIFDMMGRAEEGLLHVDTAGRPKYFMQPNALLSG
ncbi:hypothetical protein W97_05247 [Coniosporium apollinis CBS 100218]|uniref:CN hydrolase domain-containing protein n=1 Tax=Coniosporium apollinis (strain CBS 100218) TaxID=1168221 RepID=R7YW13_CONA1|nr:uncharacterized protein W97_05247 [Coniosporium apollinis CBS 100218]EON66004.1 hypothetical protein W97_05247 [Coniosporium apollinis CBS 100218]